ncbi:hypothetical protein COCC4DRAFT_173628 [Bipolaris maydis ATCC 48331]|uniref:Uncharacterized protein n=2 Tax=Cochliobolus heterostrophus TaxID=5016 RepID=M2UFJ4_COCH5|nr:uncharacterized protein COCC4DRAFT_173628 [Bipolaris maydis ATCC 48331]EMD86763.1 hypothetical protein COCHEDRAFT_1207149 [Bipolaris maydis C5]ENI03156.1 hypothetical protein COCC4DRAFT_173628 [Bipolaris maydis ATCC 48331]KAJ6267328.1 hypothetical protein PSV08DRAFT_364998 [Bipolaris maydis]KAJ6267714.1 hypothetical protein PSV08DRAFT_365162 [Bipolaris maydis]
MEQYQSDPYAAILGPYSDNAFMDSNTGIDPQVSPMGANHNGTAHPSGNPPRNDAPNASTDESFMMLLKQLVQLIIESRKEIKEVNEKLQTIQQDLRRREELERSKRSQENARKHGMEPPPRNRPLYRGPYHPDRSRMLFPPQNSAPYPPFTQSEQEWENDFY